MFGKVEEVPQKLDPICFTYQHVECIYTLLKYRVNRNNSVKSGQVFDNMQRAVYFNRTNRGLDRMPSKAKKRLLRIKYRKHLLSSFQTTKSKQTSGSDFAGRFEEVKKTKYELEFLKNVDCFLDGYGSYSSNLLTFEIESL